MRYEVVDTNVLVVADGHRTHAGDQCRGAAARKLVSVRDKGTLVLDTSMEILREYERGLRGGGEPGPGTFFYEWVVSSGAHKLVKLETHVDRGFEAFPIDPRLETFDRDDRKFVAAALVAGTTHTRIVNAVDSDYRLHRVALGEAGVVIQELCPEELSRS